jgi:hypothetical protein
MLDLMCALVVLAQLIAVIIIIVIEMRVFSHARFPLFSLSLRFILHIRV